MLEAIEYLVDEYDLHRPSVLLGIIQMSEEELAELTGVDSPTAGHNDDENQHGDTDEKRTEETQLAANRRDR